MLPKKEDRVVIEAGVAIRDITPNGPVWMDGYGARDRPSEGIYAPLTARALALRTGDTTAAIVVADILNLDRAQEVRLRESICMAMGLEPEAVVLCATHTHCGARVADLMTPGDPDPAYLTRLWDAMRDAVVEAVEGLQPAKLAFSRARSRMGINRRLPDGEGGVRFHPNPEGVIDRDLDTFWLTTPNGAALASMTTYGCHPTSRSGYLLGPDYPGFLRAGIEREWGGTALFLAGCAGNIRPAFLDANGRFRSAEIAEVEAAGEAMAAEALAGRADAVALEAPSLRVTLGTALLPIAEAPQRESLEPLAAGDDPAAAKWARRILEKLAEGPLPERTPFTIQTLRLDARHAMVFLAGEVVTEIGLRIKQAYPYQAVTPVAYSNGLIGYVPSRSIHPQGGYEVLGSYRFYYQPAPFMPDVEDVILAEVKRQMECECR
jgi:neutral ceramidase